MRGRRWSLVACSTSLRRPNSTASPDEGRLQAVRALGAADARDDLAGLPQRLRLGLALQLDVAVQVELDGQPGQPPRGGVDQDRAGRRRRLHPSGGVDGVAGDHRLALGAHGGRHRAGHHAGPRREARGRDRGSQVGNLGDELHGRPHRTLGVALDGHGSAPDRHHRVADELLDRAAVPGHHGAGDVEVPRQELPDLLGIPSLAQRRESDQVHEQHRAQPALGLGAGRAPERRPRAPQQRPRPTSRTRCRTAGRERAAPRRRDRPRSMRFRTLRRSVARGWPPRHNRGTTRGQVTQPGEPRHERPAWGIDRVRGIFYISRNYICRRKVWT